MGKFSSFGSNDDFSSVKFNKGGDDSEVSCTQEENSIVPAHTARKSNILLFNEIPPFTKNRSRFWRLRAESQILNAVWAPIEFYNKGCYSTCTSRGARHSSMIRISIGITIIIFPYKISHVVCRSSTKCIDITS